MGTRSISKFSPARIIFFSILLTIVAGTLLLWLPISRTRFIHPLDLLFTATSVTTVTGFSCINLDSFTLFGKGIITLLIQIGGLGLMTMSLFMISLFVDMGMSTRLLAGRLMELDTWRQTKRILAFIIILTLLLELIGAILMYISISKSYSMTESIFLSIFHSIASFCNAGVSLFDHKMAEFSHDTLFLSISTILMIAGGLGFVSLYEITQWFKDKFRGQRAHFSLHSKIVFGMSAILLSTAFLGLASLEWNNAFGGMTLGEKILNLIFNAASIRNAGFLTVPVGSLQVATLFLIIVISFIGSSPGSTGSGIKTVTFAIFVATIKATIQGKTSVNLLGRRIARDQVYKALTIISLSLGWIAFSTFVLLILEGQWSFFAVFFETISAFNTLGMSLGLTGFLSVMGKILIMACMIIGKVGSLTLILALKKQEGISTHDYPEERIMMS